MLVFVRSFSYTPHASFSAGEGGSRSQEIVFGYCFSFTPDASFSKVFFLHTHAGFIEEFLLHSSC